MSALYRSWEGIFSYRDPICQRVRAGGIRSFISQLIDRIFYGDLRYVILWLLLNFGDPVCPQATRSPLLRWSSHTGQTSRGEQQEEDIRKGGRHSVCILGVP